MRRSLSILLVLIFGLGPLSATLGASEDSRLPSCCRRHGMHHCAASTRMASMMAESGKTILTAPATCPLFPSSSVATVSAPQALAAAPIGLPSLIAHPHSPSAARAAARMSLVRMRAGRGPPTLFLA